MSSDDTINFAALKSLDDFVCFGISKKSREDFNSHGITGKAIGEGIAVL